MRLLAALVATTVSACTLADNVEAPAKKSPTDSAVTRPAAEIFAEIERDGQCERPRGGHPDPDALVRDFLERDARGDFLRSNPWLEAALDCAAYLGGPDSHRVVRGSRLTKVSQSSTDALYDVTYDIVGWAAPSATGSGVDFTAEPATHTVRFRLLQTGGGWRIHYDAFDWQLVAIEHARLDAATRQRLATPSTPR